jgi:saccharopine dehydrogenase (NAD+, L-lysine-forming)
MTTKQWMIYGASGYTGGILADYAVARGDRPILAGRNRQKIAAIADKLGCDYRIFDLDNSSDTIEALSDIDTIVHCAGPFSATSEAMVNACLASRTHYIDITGEIPVFERIKQRHDEALAAGITLLPGCGFDVVPTDCLAAMLKAQLPDASHLELAFSGAGGTSPGTLKTMVEMLADGGKIRRDGEIVTVAAAYYRRNIIFTNRQQRWCMSIPWGDISTAYSSTGIANIQVLTHTPWFAALMVRCFSPLMGIIANARIQRFLKDRIGQNVQGPDEQARKDGSIQLWGQVKNATGDSRELWLDVAEGYHFTVMSCYQAVHRLLEGGIDCGARTPSQAFGADYVLSIEKSVLTPG